MGTTKSDFSQMRQSRSDLIKNAEHFTQIDLHLKKNATLIIHKLLLWFFRHTLYL